MTFTDLLREFNCSTVDELAAGIRWRLFQSPIRNVYTPDEAYHWVRTLAHAVPK